MFIPDMSLNESCNSSPLTIEYRCIDAFDRLEYLLEFGNNETDKSTAPMYNGRIPMHVLIMFGIADIRVLLMKEYLE